MYQAHFGLKGNPFDMTPDPSMLFWTAAHREALAGLTYAIARNKGFVVLTGPAGTGKTTLIRKLLSSAPVPMHTGIVYNPTLSPAEFLELALADFGLPQIPMNKAQRLLRLEQFLLATHREGKAAVLIIDEAHKLSAELLEEVRLLTNFETAKQKLLQIILVGQPELNTILNRDELWQLKQRVAVRLQILPLSAVDLRQYLHCRWEKAGGGKTIPFDDSAIDLISSWSKGIPRMVNGICDNALLSAYGAGRNTVISEDILEVVHDLDLRSGTTNNRNGAHVPRTVAVAAAPLRSEPLSKTTTQIRAAAKNVEPDPPALSRLVEKFGLRIRRLGQTK